MPYRSLFPLGQEIGSSDSDVAPPKKMGKAVKSPTKKGNGVKMAVGATRKEKKWKHAPASSRFWKKVAILHHSEDSSSDLMHSTEDDSSNTQLGERVPTGVNI